MLTEQLIERISHNGPGQSYTWDSGGVRGFGVRATKGSRSFVVQTQVAGKTRRVTLGRVENMSVREARELAQVMLVGLRQGLEPDEIRGRPAAVISDEAGRSVTMAADRWLVESARTVKPGTLRRYGWIAGRFKEFMGDKLLADVTEADLVAAVSARDASEASQALMVRGWRVMWKSAVRRGWVSGVDPSAALKTAMRPRDRWLTEVELAKIGAGLEYRRRRAPASAAVLEVLALTGLRFNEVRMMRWADVDEDSRLMVIPDSKSGRRVHSLAPEALAVIQALRQVTGSSEWVFPSQDRKIAGRKPVSESSVSQLWHKICAEHGIRDARPHDLRRTVMTRGARVVSNSHTLRDMMGHATAAMADRYIRNSGQDVIQARDDVAHSVAAAMGLAAREGVGGTS